MDFSLFVMIHNTYMFIKTQAAQLKYVQFLLVNFNLNKPGKKTWRTDRIQCIL